MARSWYFYVLVFAFLAYFSIGSYSSVPTSDALAYEASSSVHFFLHGSDIDSISRPASSSTHFWEYPAGGQAIAGNASTSVSFFGLSGIINAMFRSFPPNYTQTHYHWRNDDGLEAAPLASTASTSSNSSATSSGWQRKMWYDGTRYWLGYYDGTHIEFLYSTNGTTWTKNASAEITSGTISNDFSVYGDSSHAYIILATSTLVSTAFQATGYPATNFSWTNGVTVDGIHPTIAQATDGFIYAASFDTAKFLVVAKSSSANTVTGLNNTGIISVTNSNVPTGIAPLGSGYVQVVWEDGTTIKSAHLNSTDIFNASKLTVDTGTSGFSTNASIVGDTSNDGAYMAYVDSSGHVLFKKYTTASDTWSSAVTLDSNSGNAYVNLTMDATHSNRLVTTWIRSNTIYKVAGVSPYTSSSNWDSSATAVLSTGTNTWLTSGTSDLNGYTFLGYTSGTVSPYNINTITTDFATSATSGTQDTSLTSMALSTIKRLRVEVANKGGDVGIGTQQFRLEYGAKSTTCAAISSWTDVGAVGGDWDMGDSSYLTDGNSTTNIAATYGGVSDSNSSFLSSNAGIKDTSSTAAAKTVDSTQFAELEYAVQPVGTASGNYCFRVTNAGTATGYTYTTYAESNVTASAATLTLTLDGGGTIAFGSITAGNQKKVDATRLLVTQTNATSINITAGRQRAVSNVTIASNAAPTLATNQISDTAGGIDVFNGISNCSTAGSHPATWPSQTGTSYGLGFTIFADNASSKDTTCWGSGSTKSDANNKYAALQASSSASTVISVSSSPPASFYASVGYALEVKSTQKATTYNGGVVFTATVAP